MGKISDIQVDDITYSELVTDDMTIRIANGLTSLQKRSLITATVENATDERGYISEFLLQMAFEINIIKLYTDIEFTDEDNADIYVTYDKLVRSGLLEDIISNIGRDEYDELFQAVTIEAEDTRAFNRTINGSVSGIINQLKGSEELLEEFKETINNFDKDKVKNVVELAQATGYNGQ